LVEKGALKYERVGREFVYWPSKSRESVGRGALNNILNTFFGGSIENLIASHFSGPDASIDESELNRIQKMIREAEAAKSSKSSKVPNNNKKKRSKRKRSE
jgi:predicted transcriptional regulator